MIRAGFMVLRCIALVSLVGALPAAAVAHDPEPLPAVFAVTAGDTHTCATWWYGSSCWGDNDEGMLGNGTASGLLLAPIAPPAISPEFVVTPRPAAYPRPFARLDAGSTATCALATGQGGTIEGTVWCWGSGPLGRVCFGGDPLGFGGPTAVWMGPPTNGDGDEGCGTAVLGSVRAVAVAGSRACGLVEPELTPSGGELWCWDSTGHQADLLAHPLPGPDGGAMSGVVMIDGSSDGFCAITSDGSAWCWGGTETTPPVRVSGVEDAVAVAVGGDHACAQVGDGSVWCWGANDRGQLGDGTMNASATAVRVVGLDGSTPTWLPDRGHLPYDQVILGAGRAHSCVLRGRLEGPAAAQQVLCWGANDHGQLGDGSTQDRSSAVSAVDLDPEVGVRSLALGGDHTCAVTGETSTTTSPDPTMGGFQSSGILRCWGANEHGQLGTGDRGDRSRPTIVVTTDVPRLAELPD